MKPQDPQDPKNPQDPLSRAEQSSGPSDSDDTASPTGGERPSQAGGAGAVRGRLSPGDGSGGSDAGGGPSSEEASEAVREHAGGRLNRP